MRTWDLWLCIIIYTITLVWFGGWAEYKLLGFQLKKIEEKVWSEGCNRCAQFEKDACARDQLQGIDKEHQIK